ncbi:CHAP domain-containing protein [Nonomuraea sp. NPDC003754]
MTPETDKLIKLLESELGYSEGKGAYTKFGDWYGKTVEFDADYSGAPWCDMFLSWAAHKLGYEEWVGQFAYTVAHAKWFKENDAWGHQPKPGALVFYDWSGSNKIDNIDHVGIVTRVEGDTIFTIEGNIDGGIAKRKERDQSKVAGYGYPEKIKKRLDAAKLKEAEVDGSLAPDTEPSQVDRLQLPAQTETTSVTALIPRHEAPSTAPSVSVAGREHAVSPAAPLSPSPLSTSAVSASPSPSSPSSPSPSPGTSTGTSPGTSIGTSRPAEAPVATAARQPGTNAQQPSTKKGKHAKPATADTEATTREPVTAFKDASSTTPAPGIGSPAIIGPVLLAALGLLAVARTRQLRVRPAAPAPSRTTRRPGRRSAGTRRRAPGQARPEPLLAATTTTPELAPPTATPFSVAGLPSAAPLLTGLPSVADASLALSASAGAAASSTVAATGSAALDTLSHTRQSDLDAAAALAAGLEASNAVLAELESSTTAPFDAFSAARQGDVLSTDLNLFGAGGNPFRDDDAILGTDLNLFGGPSPFRDEDATLSTDLNLFGGPSPFRDEDATLSTDLNLFGGPSPFRDEDATLSTDLDLFGGPSPLRDDLFGASHGQAAPASWEGSAFAAAQESRSLGGYRGRRRRREHPVEESTTFRPDLPARGRRHRTTENVRPHRATSTGAPATAFSLDAPLRGRRHRPTPVPAHPSPASSNGPTRTAAVHPSTAHAALTHTGATHPSTAHAGPTHTATADLSPASSNPGQEHAGPVLPGSFRTLIEPLPAHRPLFQSPVVPTPEPWDTLWEAVAKEPVLTGAAPSRDTSANTGSDAAGRTSARNRRGRHRA